MAALTNPTGAVTVNVGGTVYTTTLATLTRVEGSMLGALAEALSDGEVLFIDRDGPSFRYVLNYLRDPFAKPLLPGTGAEREQLAREADFYGIPGLFYTMNLAGPFVASRGNQVGTVYTHANYELAFTMTLASDWTHVSAGGRARLTNGRLDEHGRLAGPSRKGGWQSILHIGNSNSQRLPGIWFHNSQNALHVMHAPPFQWGVKATTGTYDAETSTGPFAAGGTYEIKVVVQSNQMTVYVDGASVGTASGSATDSDFQIETNMAVYVGDPWHPAAKVTLSDISYTGRNHPS